MERDRQGWIRPELFLRARCPNGPHAAHWADGRYLREAGAPIEARRFTSHDVYSLRHAFAHAPARARGGRQTHRRPARPSQSGAPPAAYLRLDIDTLRGGRPRGAPQLRSRVPEGPTMRTPKPLAAWDAAVTAYADQPPRAGSPVTTKSEYTLEHSAPLSGAGRRRRSRRSNCFDRWRALVLSRQRPRTRNDARAHRAISFCRYRRRSEPRCFVPDPEHLARPKPLPLPRIIEREQVIVSAALRLSAACPAHVEPLRPTVLRLAILLLYTSRAAPR